MIWMFDLAESLHWMPSLRQPFPFIWTWDWHKEHSWLVAVDIKLLYINFKLFVCKYTLLVCSTLWLSMILLQVQYHLIRLRLLKIGKTFQSFIPLLNDWYNFKHVWHQGKTVLWTLESKNQGNSIKISIFRSKLTACSHFMSPSVSLWHSFYTIPR